MSGEIWIEENDHNRQLESDHLSKKRPMANDLCEVCMGPPLLPLMSRQIGPASITVSDTGGFSCWIGESSNSSGGITHSSGSGGVEAEEISLGAEHLEDEPTSDANLGRGEKRSADPFFLLH
ncbi:UNVERIFIED_CONTAM: hypothetical protein K2H54_049133 [Gekko kuhli]